MRVTIRLLDETAAIDAPTGWQLVSRNAEVAVLERPGASAEDLLIWIRMLHDHTLRGLEFTRLSES